MTVDTRETTTKIKRHDHQKDCEQWNRSWQETINRTKRGSGGVVVTLICVRHSDICPTNWKTWVQDRDCYTPHLVYGRRKKVSILLCIYLFIVRNEDCNNHPLFPFFILPSLLLFTTSFSSFLFVPIDFINNNKSLTSKNTWNASKNLGTIMNHFEKSHTYIHHSYSLTSYSFKFGNLKFRRKASLGFERGLSIWKFYRFLVNTKWLLKHK